jgi:hypothetical protein
MEYFGIDLFKFIVFFKKNLKKIKKNLKKKKKIFFRINQIGEKLIWN